MKRFLLLAAALIGSAIASWGQGALPLDPAVKVGKLDNGMTYYIRHNELPAQRAEFYLATNVGAIQETPDQDGLAHFLEHMCFNGTKNFPGKTLLNWLESIGASFGGNINASTGIEQTQYMLNNIPLTRPSVLDSCLLIMHDYSHFVALEPSEIDAERGVILEEKRTRNTADWRTYMESKKYLFKGTKLAECSLIGSEENLKTFKPSSIENFYHTWYRPDLQALIVVGDIDVNEVEAKVKTIFSDIPAVENPKAKDVITIPVNEEPIVGIITDKEATSNTIEMYWKSEASPKEMKGTVIGFVENTLRNIVGNIMYERFQAIAAQPDAPFTSASAFIGSICNSTDVFAGDVNFKEGQGVKAMEALYTEIERMARYGFTDDEIQRAKDDILSSYETAVKKADTRKNAEFVYPLINNFFRGDYVLDPAMAHQVAQMLLAQLDANAINAAIKQLVTNENLVVLVCGTDKEGAVPTEAEVLDVIARVRASEIAAPVAEDIPTAFLDPAKLKGSAVKSRTAGIYDSETIVLKNGIKVILNPTDIEKDRILFKIFEKGGRSLIPDADLYSFDQPVWSLFVNNSGISRFSNNTVGKMLSGKQLSVSPFINIFTHGVNGTSTAKDLETALQIAYLYYADPRFDENEFNQGIKQLEAILPNMESQPDYQIQKAIYEVIYQSPRRFATSLENVAKADLATLKADYTKLFSSAKGATAIISGDFNKEEIIPLVEKYIGSINTKGKASDWTYRNDGIANGSKIKDFKTPMQTPKVTVLQVYKADKPYSVEAEVTYSALEYILDMVYVATLREEEGGTYGASASTGVGNKPDEYRVLQVAFDTNTEQADKLRELAKKGLSDIAANGPDAEQFDKTVKNLEKKLPESKLRVSYWHSCIEDNILYGIDYVSEYEAAVKALTPEKIQAAAAELCEGYLSEIIMRPEE